MQRRAVSLRHLTGDEHRAIVLITLDRLVAVVAAGPARIDQTSGPTAQHATARNDKASSAVWNIGCVLSAATSEDQREAQRAKASWQPPFIVHALSFR